MSPTRVILPLFVSFLASCTSLLQEPWSQHLQGDQAVGVSTGWTWMRAEIDLEPRSQEGPIDEADAELWDFDTNYVAAARHEYFLTDHWLLGTRIEWRGYHNKSFELAGRDIRARDYGTISFVESLRYLFDAVDEEGRWRPFAGAELAYQPGYDFHADVSGPDGDSPREKIRFRGSGLYSLGATVGGAYLWNDETILEVGALYEWPLGASEEQIRFGDPFDPTVTDWELEPRGLILFVSLITAF